jgi:trimeric autotransporter adhesin
LNYIYAKAIDNSASFGGGVAQDDYNLRAERGLSSFDQRHNLTANYYLTSPVGERGLLRTSRWGGRFLADWSLSGRFTLLSGSPLTARVLGNRANTGGAIGSGRADATGLDVSDGPGFFNLLAFAIPAPGRFGGAGRNTIPGPSRFSSSIGLGRSFRLGPDSKRRIEFRFESTNFLNHVSYANLGTVVNASNYGLALSAAAMRSNNATLRLRF